MPCCPKELNLLDCVPGWSRKRLFYVQHKIIWITNIPQILMATETVVSIVDYVNSFQLLLYSILKPGVLLCCTQLLFQALLLHSQMSVPQFKAMTASSDVVSTNTWDGGPLIDGVWHHLNRSCWDMSWCRGLCNQWVSLCDTCSVLQFNYYLIDWSSCIQCLGSIA